MKMGVIRIIASMSSIGACHKKDNDSDDEDDGDHNHCEKILIYPF